MGKTFGTYGRGAYRVWMGKWERHRSLVIVTLRLEDKTDKTVLQKLWWIARERQ
jgi:hypothetical protein